MVQTIVFSSAIVAMGLANDLQKGIVDRIKSLPISRASVLVGRSIFSLIHSSLGIAVMAITGLVVGWRIRTNVLDAALGFLLLLLFGFAMIWLGNWMGSLMRTVEAVQGLMFTVMFPLTFVANTFAPPENMPSVQWVIAEWNPVSARVFGPSRRGSWAVTLSNTTTREDTMTTRPHDVADLYLAPLALHLDASLERFSGKSPQELDVEVAIATNREPRGAAERREVLLDTVTHLVDLQGWTVSWHDRGLRLAHDEHSIVLGIPASLRSYLQA